DRGRGRSARRASSRAALALRVRGSTSRDCLTRPIGVPPPLNLHSLPTAEADSLDGRQILGGNMAILILGLVLFLGIHLVRVVAPGFREAQLAASEGRWKGIYSLVSIAGIALIVWGWHLYRADAPELYEPP